MIITALAIEIVGRGAGWEGLRRQGNMGGGCLGNKETLGGARDGGMEEWWRGGLGVTASAVEE